ncbi:MAG: hypothetical protein AB7T63_06620 [Planctomycetota bacterium]
MICTDTAPALQWQCELLEHTWHAVQQPGQLLRLVAASADQPLPEHRHARVLRVPPSNLDPLGGDAYIAANRLSSLAHWLREEQPEGTVLILDPDMVFRTPQALWAAPGKPIAQRWVDFGDGSWLADRMGVERSSLQPATWPIAIHTIDLASLLPRWSQRTVDVYRATGRWESDMFALVQAASEIGLSFDLATTCAWMPWPEATVAGAPIIHYCQPVQAHDGSTIWDKRSYHPWATDFEPALALLDYCRELLEIVMGYARLRSTGVPRGTGEYRVRANPMD